MLDSENGKGPIGGTLKEFAESRGVHRSDAMADWILENGLMSTVHMAPFPKNEELTMELMRDPKTVGNISDAGAHLQMLCGGGENALLLTKYVREERAISIEQAREQPVWLSASGPAAGVAAAARIARDAGEERVLTCDLGGTSFDVAHLADGAPARTQRRISGFTRAS